MGTLINPQTLTPHSSHPLIIAHRGASSDAKENTIAAFEQAIALSADLVEFDVRRTQDQVLIVHHDAAVDFQQIEHLTWAEVQAMDAEIPTLEAVITCCKGRIRLDVELKEAGYEREAIDLLLRHLSIDDFVMTSFDPQVLKQVKQHCSDVSVGFLMEQETLDQMAKLNLTAEEMSDRLQALQLDFIAPHWKLLQTDLVTKAGQNLPIWVWTVNDASVIRRLMGDRQITGIITDKPDLGIRVRQESGKEFGKTQTTTAIDG